MKSITFTGPTDKLPGCWHQSYPHIFRRLFAGIEHTQDSILEIGTDSGHPLLAYREYFNNAGKVIGIDVNPTPECVRNAAGVIHYQRDAYTHETLELLQNSAAPFACIIDDGSHFLHHQMFLMEHYPKLLSGDGILICEDIQDMSHVPQLIGKLPQGLNGYCIDARYRDDRYDSALLIVERSA